MTGRFEFLSTADAPPAPRTVRLAFRAAIVWAAFTAVSGFALIGAHSYVYRELIKQNNDASTKNKKANYVGSVVDHDVHRVMVSGVVTSILSALIILLLATMVLRARAAGRWGLILMATVLPLVVPFGTGVLIQLIGPLTKSDVPWWYRTLELIAGVASVTVLVLMTVPETARFFVANRPDRGTRASLFGNRRGAAARGSAGVVDVEASPTRSDASTADGVVNGSPVRPRVRKDSATRPGSVKPKGGAAPRGGRAKSRNQ